MISRIATITTTFLFCISSVAVGQPTSPTLPERMENFRLIDQTDRSWELYRLREAPAVVIFVYGVGCPIVRLSAPGLETLKTEYTEKGVQFIGLNPNVLDNREEVAKEAEEYSVTLPILMDTSGAISSSLGITRMAEFIVAVPKQDWKIVYRGPMDDRFDYGSQKPEATKTWLRDALEAVLAERAPETAVVQTKGCLVNMPKVEEVSYAKDIVPILQSKCTDCHVEGGIGPFALDSYDRVRKWAPMMRETIRTKLMPPWHADPHYGKFSNARALSSEEERTLLAWIERGAPKTEEEPDPLAENVKPREAVWAMGEPDLVLQLPNPEEIPATGIVDYRYITVPTGLTEDKWVSGLEVLPTDPTVVHHALIFVAYPKQYRHIQPRSESGLNGYFAAYLPGARIKPYPDGTGQFLPAGSSLVFQMHYNTTGKASVDQTKMGLYFHKSTPAKTLLIEAAAETDFGIPPNVQDHPIAAAERFRRPIEVHGLSPHMHYRGGRARFIAMQPDGAVNTMLNVPFYEFDWQPMYFFEEPISLPEGSRMRVEGAFDNSVFNPKNPDPNKFVYFGEQSFEEMFIGYIAYAVPYDAERFAPREIDPADYVGYGQTLNKETLVGTKWSVMRQITVSLEADGVAIANNFVRGTWEVRGNDIYITSPIENITVSIQGDELLFRGRPMRRLE